MRKLLVVGALAYCAGVASVYIAGPAVGRRLTHVGATLVGLDGDQGFTSAREAGAFIEQAAKVAVAEEARRFLPPARVYK